jgi:peptide subunit release factor RF-3
MKVYDAAAIRNVALVGHSGAGKTQLVSALLFDAGASNRLGRVDDGTTVTDYDDEEIARKHTLSAALAYAEWNRIKINFIDTPGMANFLSDARAAMRVCDTALVSDGKPVGLIDGRTQLLIGQLVAVVISWLLAAVATFIILKILDVTMGLRVKRDHEIQGLDLSQHGEEGYIFI